MTAMIPMVWIVDSRPRNQPEHACRAEAAYRRRREREDARVVQDDVRYVAYSRKDVGGDM